MHRQIRKLGVASVAAMSTAAAIAGCGGSGSDNTAQPSAVGGAMGTQKVAQAPAHVQQKAKTPATLAAQAKSSRAQHKAATHSRKHAVHHASTSPGRSQQKRRETYAHVIKHNLAARRAFVLKSAPGVLKLLGFRNPVVKVDRPATTVTVLIAANEACGHNRATERKVQSGIKHAIHFVRTVNVLVGSQSFSSYATANCKPVVLPNVSGKLVYSASGHTGDTTTPSFTISGSSWTVAYENDGSFLSMFVLKDDKYTTQYFTTQTTGTGKQTFKGHGTFKLRISASADWTVKVYD